MSVPPLSDTLRVELVAGALIGANTVGASLRNANWSLRSVAPNPHVEVAPWPSPPRAPHTPLAEPAEDESFPTDASRVPRAPPLLVRSHAMSARPREEGDSAWSSAEFPPPPVLEPVPSARPSRVVHVSDDLPTVYVRALEMQGDDAPWDYVSARRALEDAIDAESVPGGRFLPVAFQYPRDDGGFTFRMLLMSEESIVPHADGNGTHANHTGVARPVGDYGIGQELALRYLTYDYLSHRSRQEGIGLRLAIGTDGFSARARVAEEHRATFLECHLDAHDDVLYHFAK
jgi:hypothetical protein